MEHLYPVFNGKQKTLVKNLRNNIDSAQPFDLWDYVISTTFDTICREYYIHAVVYIYYYLFSKIYISQVHYLYNEYALLLYRVIIIIIIIERNKNISV